MTDDELNAIAEMTSSMLEQTEDQMVVNLDACGDPCPDTIKYLATVVARVDDRPFPEGSDYHVAMAAQRLAESENVAVSYALAWTICTRTYRGTKRWSASWS